ncbi:hypothetical protein [Streptomyces sp. CA-146814]|uniref:hypothetical protein n=1 Tax=Streptomyces sp. CA-146814 TaxID=3240053 RepID=UPI003D90BF0A
MKSPSVRRRLAPALVIAQLAYLVLMQLAFTFLAPESAEPRSEESARTALLGYGATVAAVAVVLAGGALMLASSRASARVPRPVRAALLVLLGLVELGIAAAFLRSAVTGSLGPDTLIAGVAVVVSGCVAAACVQGLRTQPDGSYGATGSRSPRGSSASCSRNGSTAARHPSGWS